MPARLNATVALHGLVAMAYAALTIWILTRRHVGPTGRRLAGAVLVTALWGAAIAGIEGPRTALLAAAFDVLRPAAWCGFLYHLYRRSVGGQTRRGRMIGLAGLAGTVALLAGLVEAAHLPGEFGQLWVVQAILRVVLGVGAILLVENIALNTPPDERWHINLACIALAALSAYDIALGADALLFPTFSLALFDGRAVAMLLVAPLLALVAMRNRRGWGATLRISRSAVFHSATLLVSGVFLLGLFAVGEGLRWLRVEWANLAEISLLFAGAVTIAVMLTARSARSRLRRLLVDHFFSNRYDYRREWIRCIAILSAPDNFVALHARVIRAVTEIVDSPGGMLFLADGGVFRWAGSLNMPAAAVPVLADHPLPTALRDGTWIVVLSELPAEEPDPLAGGWLAVPLNHGGRMAGFVIVAPPRAPLDLDREVYDLLRVVGRQVAAHVAEQRASETLAQTRELREWGKRFAFVAHDIKNVASQLSLLLANAETHLENPEFQRDMLQTIRAAVAKIEALIRRLQRPAEEAAQMVAVPAERLETLVAEMRRVRAAPIEFTQDGRAFPVAMMPAAFDAVAIHLLDNAFDASASTGHPVRVVLRHQARRVQIDIIDEGGGMTPEFVRDELFRPFRSSKPGGSGIGAFQARELLREAGGDLVVISMVGDGPTMRILLPLAEAAAEAEA